jgi:hypothetical protein
MNEKKCPNEEVQKLSDRGYDTLIKEGYTKEEIDELYEFFMSLFRGDFMKCPRKGCKGTMKKESENEDTKLFTCNKCGYSEIVEK